MTQRQQRVMEAMTLKMQQQFEENAWREEMPFPNIDELFRRAVCSLSEACKHALIGSERAAMKHAADAANLAGLMVLFGEKDRQ